MKPKLVEPAPPLAQIESDLDALLRDGKPIRRDFGNGNRLHMDRPLPFLCVHVGSHQDAAFHAVSANASYLIAADIGLAREAARLVVRRLRDHCGAFLMLDIGELAEDRFLTEDVPFLPPFEIALACGDTAAEKAALKRFATAASAREAKYRTPRVDELNPTTRAEARLLDDLGDAACLTVRFAPIYRVPGTKRVYPELHDLVVANMVDSALQAVSAFLKASRLEQPATHRSLGRRAYIDAVVRADRAIDNVASTFDFLLAVTPINAEPAWLEFQAGAFERVPVLLYRPLEFEVAGQKRKLYSVSLDHLEDPLLTTLLSQKQQELDLQLSMLAARETPRFVELGRALYGSVEPSLAARARAILEKAPSVASATRQKGLGADAVAAAARDMIAGYRAAYPEFDASVEIRGDLPAGLLVSRNRLLVSRDTNLPPERLTALLSHEIGVHLLTYFNGDAQGLAIFRNGLAGYEGMQEGLAVLAEYLVGGMTAARLRLIAARVIACQAMLDGATFEETFRILHRDFGLDDRGAFNVVLRVYRGGGLAKDAIYLRGMVQILDHLKDGGSLTPFWIGKISAAHFGAIQELNARGLLRAPRLEPAFLSSDAARPRLKKAMAGIGPIDMVET
ncbi:MAG: flavohemoglobin expression-modulating QEGLA motif protein [Mesorhizobium sp.]|uniref:flavohemoglobin expression-modulating QEGLA motif protein n=1 Tax=Mesorhizobium sp. TaxID=1871066 RepID=UPI000FE6E695|nr:MAG: flavohemoglobin expression-modulating QEGLA motif protein [Mesorhizobium sp.]RWP14800.1 MAG: flavohemoglobin expression-modulating QEGLA motif protein [Mesorhizobium sp.]RWQ07499.1 MAG: flavohemoglobin expression-modulating QEGLA motif protein [Mesorhizobium sp.]RWQ27635.1 MAG: flavohemoglobin expression-modulating QEGLA motif protein [Mesorhizobium sp.]RWQ43533.1 MAG: flavohemoglobin expression-modulating QEGLA motif protein [Mesorhizobium sp.]